ncbi:tape measure protein, partial [Lacticaseibacillus paracasei]
IGGLKQLGADGELVSSRVFKAILNAQPKIEAAFAVTNQTIGEGVTKINNAFTQYIGKSDASLSATGRLVSGLGLLADNFDTTADITLRLASI